MRVCFAPAPLPHSYGALLIDVAENNAGFRLGAPALADDSSHLHQRIMAMNAARPKFALVRGGVFGALALVAVLAACEAKMPTSADVDKLDAATAERVATKLALKSAADSTVYFVDGVQTTAEKANALAPTSIDAIEIKKSRTRQSVISIRTKKDPLAVATMDPKGERDRVEVLQNKLARRPDSDSTVVTLRPLKTELAKASPARLPRRCEVDVIGARNAQQRGHRVGRGPQGHRRGGLRERSACREWRHRHQDEEGRLEVVVFLTNQTSRRARDGAPRVVCGSEHLAGRDTES